MTVRGKTAGLVLWLALGTSASGLATGLDRYLAAHWTVRDGALQADLPDLPFAEGNPKASGPGGGIADGFLRLGADHLFAATEMNATRFPALAGGVTLWARLRFDGQPPTDGFFFGLSGQAAPADWKDMALAVLYRGGGETPVVGPFATLDGGGTLGVGPSRMIPVRAGSDLTIGIAFDGVSNTVTLWVNGASATQTVIAPAPTRLRPFQSLGLGRLKASGSVPVSFREVRVYSVPLNAEWIGEIGADAPAN